MFYELQPLRIQAGWTVEFNYFSEYDRCIHGDTDLFELNEDLLQLYHPKANLIIDLGWYPAHNADGEYVLFLVKDCNWNCPLERFSSQSKKEIIDHIEKWVCYDFFGKYC